MYKTIIDNISSLNVEKLIVYELSKFLMRDRLLGTFLANYNASHNLHIKMSELLNVWLAHLGYQSYLCQDRISVLNYVKVDGFSDVSLSFVWRVTKEGSEFWFEENDRFKKYIEPIAKNIESYV